jgi:asparagine synthase (glutamine-hydrolysing)
MCGIAGIISLKKIDIVAAISTMSKTLEHRGPDGEGFYFFNEHDCAAFSADTPDSIKYSSLKYAPKTFIEQAPINSSIAFAHRRLSIIDLEATGHQPQCDENENIWLTFNGEIYNYLEIKIELEALGNVFIGKSDTEVIIKSYLQWGKDCIKKFNGMWAFALFDKRTNEIWCSRDRFGVKPFYYILTKDFFAFASEQKALLKLRGFGLLNTEINNKAVFDYFIHSQIEYNTEGMFKNIIELMPSHHLIVKTKSLETEIKKYYTLEVNNEYVDFNEATCNTYAEKLKSLFEDAVKIRLRSDVPIGACLSGGIDSSAIVCNMHILQPETTFHTFTTSFSETKFDESNFAKIVSEKSKTKFHTITPNSEGLIKDLESLMYCQDVPIWSTSTYAQYSLMQLAKENHINVLLDGQGGDELFGGYPHHLLSYTGEKISNRFFEGLDLAMNNTSFLSRTLAKNNLANKLPNFLIKSFQRNTREDINYFNEEFLSTNLESFKNKFTFKLGSLNLQLQHELNNSLLKNYLKCEDRCSMYHGIESRTPFSDDLNVIEYAMQIPSSYKIHNGISKFILRESQKDILPNQILKRKDKMGYSTPNNDWIYEIKNNVKHYFDNPILEEFMDVSSLLKNYDSFFDKRNKPETGRIFKFISFAVWLKVFDLK